MISQRITTAPLIVGMVSVYCPACGESLMVDVRIKSISTDNGSYVRVNFQEEVPDHACVGRRS